MLLRLENRWNYPAMLLAQVSVLDPTAECSSGQHQALYIRSVQCDIDTFA